MKYLYNKSEKNEQRKKLRKEQTDTEALLWFHLRARRLLGKKFVRQYSVGSYILDFYCPEKRLAIELDGGQHNDESNREYDLRHTNFLETQDITVLRFWNNEVF